jgi:hypothetical protein
MKTALPLFAIVALSACATVPAPVRADGFAGLGERTRAGPLLVRPDKVVEDSRCPMNARCVWAGRVVVRTTVWESGRASSRDLTLGVPMAVSGAELVLDTVEPGRTTGSAIVPGDWQFHYEVRR